LKFIQSASGRKLKYGNDQQKAIYQNFMLHWKEHVEMAQKLTPPKDIEFKGSITVDPSKYPPDAQAKMFQAAGLEVSPTELHPEDQDHEITQEKEGIDAQGIPTKTKVSVVGKPLR